MVVYEIYKTNGYGKDERLALVSSKSKAVDYIKACLGNVTEGYYGNAILKTDRQHAFINDALIRRTVCDYRFYRVSNGGYFIDGYYVEEITVE